MKITKNIISILTVLCALVTVPQLYAAENDTISAPMAQSGIMSPASEAAGVEKADNLGVPEETQNVPLTEADTPGPSKEIAAPSGDQEETNSAQQDTNTSQSETLSTIAKGAEAVENATRVGSLCGLADTTYAGAVFCTGVGAVNIISDVVGWIFRKLSRSAEKSDAPAPNTSSQSQPYRDYH